LRIASALLDNSSPRAIRAWSSVSSLGMPRLPGNGSASPGQR
jgi:hypothetical protein